MKWSPRRIPGQKEARKHSRRGIGSRLRSRRKRGSKKAVATTSRSEANSTGWIALALMKIIAVAQKNTPVIKMKILRGKEVMDGA
tara:strand:- start:1901 stop:2155 length:255 start_codon:yes stop_codon:yes gene_type:complete